MGASQNSSAYEALVRLPYALASDGSLKWLIRNAGNKGVAVGADGISCTSPHLAKSGYTFDTANSVLTRSITK
jgi:hypothetical protein